MKDTVRKAVMTDAPRIAEIYEAIHTEEEQGNAFIGWQRGIYPTLATAELGISEGDMFVLADEADRIVAAARLNQQQCPQYAEADWHYSAEDDEVMVMHTLVVDPAEQGKHCGAEMLLFYEDYAKRSGCRYLRIDTNERNKTARAFYGKYGYTEVGTVMGEFNGMPDIPLVCMEKKI